MKYCIFDFNQAEVIKIEGLDVEDLLILQYIKDSIASPSMEHRLDNKEYYVWLNHARVLQDLPILNMKESRFRQKLKNLIQLDLIKTISISEKGLKGTKSFYTITPKCEQLYYEPGRKNSTRSPEPGRKNSTSYNTISNISNNDKFLGSIKTLQDNNKDNKIDRYMELYRKHCGNFQRVRKLTEDRKRMILTIIDKFTWDEITEAFDKANESDFMQGKCDGTWKADFEFFLKEKNMVKILEGKYDNRTKRKQSADGLPVPKKVTKEELENEYIYKF